MALISMCICEDIYFFYWNKYAADANIIYLTYTIDWWCVIGPFIHGDSKSRSSLDHLGLLHTLSTIEAQELKLRVCFLLEALVNWLTKVKVGISKSRSAAYIISACYIKDKTVIVFNGDFRCRLTKIIWTKQRVPTYCVGPVFYFRQTLSTPYHANNKANNCNSKRHYRALGL